MRSTADITLRRWALALVALFGLLVGGTWTTVKVTTSYLLEQDAANEARDWAEFLAANVADLEQIADGEQPVAASMRFFEIARKSGQVFRYVIFNRDGYSQLVSDRTTIAPVDLSEFSPQAAQAIRTENPLVAFRKAESPDLPAYFAEAYVPVRVGNRPVAVVAAYVAQTDARSLFYRAFVAAAAALCGLTALSFGVPAIAWLRQTREKQRADRRIRYLAHHDSLTGLMNRAHFIERLECALEQGAADGRGIALHFVDIDRFKSVNDTLGHDGGDAVLKTLAARLRAASRADDLVARLGGDEFVVAQTGVLDQEQAEAFARRLRSVVIAPMRFHEHEIVATVSIGTAVSPMHGNASERLLKSADLAVYDAKSSGRNCIRTFSPEMDVAMQARLALERTIREATEHDKFSVCYQPIFELRDRRLASFEALLRLRDAYGADIPPAVFIPVAEEMHLIGRIGVFVLREACRAAAAWPAPMKVAVNLSPAQFEAGGVSEAVAAALRESGLAPGRLELEITEALLFANDQRNMSELLRLKALGVAVVMDDFGTGYSSLGNLWMFPFDKIKIDRSFTQGLGGRDPKVETVVKTIIALGRELGMPVTVEGVETADQLRFLESVEAQQVQGFLFGRPMPPADAALAILDDLRRQGDRPDRPEPGRLPLQLVT
ncbi:MAG TPA: EAL domain-containing protein [Xanthobacteraceae bacterium]|nr:EAL domain-containing protein [Xanthobacteraceae bacterium]